MEYLYPKYLSLVRKIVICFFLCLTGYYLSAQSLFQVSDTLHKKRVAGIYAFSGATFTAFSIGLYNIWYKNYERESFHLFNDLGEWKQMDKVGHIHTNYFYTALNYKLARWSGMNKKSSIISGVAVGLMYQSAVEIMDGFSTKWGFSIGDMGANIAGASTFALQQHFWDDQRIVIKISSNPNNYSSSKIISNDLKETSSLSERAGDLFGINFFEKFIKDYNAQTYWASINVHSFLAKDNKWPKWLNVAVGYGAENMYGGFENEWIQNGHPFSISKVDYPRYRQFYLSLDIDPPKLNPKNHFLKSVCSVLNIFKVPAPALEINTQGQVLFHLLR